jgi:uncharacterized SAM-binding protein YcdF (DUF218 family)
VKKSVLIRTFLVFGVIFVVGIIFSEPLLNSVSQALVYKDPLVKTEAIVVLAGGMGNRVETAARLYQEGFGEKLFFSGFEMYPGTYTSTLMKNYALELGVPEDKIVASIPDVEVSTRGESVANLELLNKNHIKKFILVTSAFHTRRSKLMYEDAVLLLGYDIEFLVYPAPDPFVPILGWWKLRTGQKNILYEYIKSIAYYFTL